MISPLADRRPLPVKIDHIAYRYVGGLRNPSTLKQRKNARVMEILFKSAHRSIIFSAMERPAHQCRERARMWELTSRHTGNWLSKKECSVKVRQMSSLTELDRNLTKNVDFDTIA